MRWMMWRAISARPNSEGMEFYCQTKPEWMKEVAGCRFGEVLTKFETGIPVGYRRAGWTVLNPEDNTMLMEAGGVL
jgi:hypothetical protein